MRALGVITLSFVFLLFAASSGRGDLTLRVEPILSGPAPVELAQKDKKKEKGKGKEKDGKKGEEDEEELAPSLDGSRV